MWGAIWLVPRACSLPLLLYYPPVQVQGHPAAEVDQVTSWGVLSNLPLCHRGCVMQVARWESLHYNECGQSTLLRFRGRPDELSPLARLSAWLGGPLPFDRHDW